MTGAMTLIRGALTLALAAAAEAAVLACPICFQTTDGSAATGVRAAVLVLLGVTTAVLAGFAWFAAGLRPSSSRRLVGAPLSKRTLRALHPVRLGASDRINSLSWASVEDETSALLPVRRVMGPARRRMMGPGR